MIAFLRHHHHHHHWHHPEARPTIPSEEEEEEEKEGEHLLELAGFVGAQQDGNLSRLWHLLQRLRAWTRNQ
jgi:hypothetical protein